MIPSFVILKGALWPVLPPGVHEATIDEIKLRYTSTPKRVQLFSGLEKALGNLFGAGSPQIFLDGSFITAKPEPNDYELLWDRHFVDPNLIDPLFLDFSAGTYYQKEKYLGEFFPLGLIERGSGKSFFEFFQTDKVSGGRKGIVRVLNYLKTGGTT